MAVYCHKDVRQLEKLKGEGIHKAEEIEVFVLDPDFISALVRCLQRRMTLDLTVTEGQLYVSAGNDSMDSTLQRFALV